MKPAQSIHLVFRRYVDARYAHTKVVFAGIMLLLLLAAGERSVHASSDSDKSSYVICPGPLVSTSVTGHGIGWGGELTVLRLAGNVAMGGFLQAQRSADGRIRLDVGVQGGPGWGYELGWAFSSRGDSMGRYSGPRLGLYLSLGYVSAAMRFTVPIEWSEGARPPLDFGFVFTFKLPTILYPRFRVFPTPDSFNVR